MPNIAIDARTKRDGLKTKRKVLFERFLKSPLDIHLALEIKLIDDQVAECTSQIRRQRETEQ